jgi:hypothetical protein
VAVACGALLLTPAAAPAAVDFGSNLSGTPTGFLNCMSVGCTAWSRAAGSGSINGVTAPGDGVVTSFTLKKDSLSGGFHWGELQPRVVQLLSGGTWRGLALTAPRVRPTGVPGQETFPTRVPITAGSFLALESPPESLAGVFAVRSTPGSGILARSIPSLPADGSPGSAAESTGELMMRARLEPDADHDGFGDETQDGCSVSAKSQTVCPPKKCKKKKAKKRAAESKKKKCKKRKRH